MQKIKLHGQFALCTNYNVTNHLISDIWYCSERCELGQEDDDHVLNHTKGLLANGLQHLARRAAVRTGNGPAIVDDWKMDLLQFWKLHPKYFINAHYFLACKYIINMNV